MRPQVLFLTLAVLGVLAALPLSKGKEQGGTLAKKDANQAWPCCDKCGLCLLSFPPQCNCLDFSQGGCHPACRNCLMFTTSGSVLEPPVYRCADFLYNYCERRCTPEPDVV
ncbi:unnamed protein product [Miscanthus lutarioriparius]|uniref:Bowman-Birk serine protease inhibitors family domain-containing protein n=1 Tax=Miscanthus lutarioriparius TaxID=422564 RepID=A0A811NSJ2_9POAL|nr:unnamed protein product [Miscanthus lutarioriparius]